MLLAFSRKTIVSRFLKPYLWKNKSLPSISYFHNISNNNSSQPPVPPKEIRLPNIMDFPRIKWPSVINSFRNWFFYNFVIKNSLDKDFDMVEFMKGVKMAVGTVTTELMSGNLDNLKGLVTDDALSEIKKNLSNFSSYQRSLLKVAPEDIYFMFPYRIGIIMPDDDQQENASQDTESIKKNQKRYVEITVVLHTIPGFAEKTKVNEGAFLKQHLQSEESKKSVMICNYRFLRDYSIGIGTSNDEWIITLANHFLPADYDY